MDPELLVEKQIEDGQRLIDQLIRDGTDVSVVFWVKTAEEGARHLYVASPQFHPEKLGEAYRRVYASLGRVPNCSVSPSDLKLINGAHPAARAAAMELDRSRGTAWPHFSRKRLGNLSIEEAYIYPPPAKWFKGFDETKQHFPSAEVFTIPILAKDAHPPQFPVPTGMVNADLFEGRRPTTVLFIGSQYSSAKPLAELFFVYRPEGWNTIFRPETGRYEEVRFTGSGAPLYQSADFSPLAALRTERKPCEDQIEQIKAEVQKGCFITLPPDQTPIKSLPYTPPAKPGGEPPHTIDWEWLREYMECGGTIDLHRAPDGPKK